MWPNPPFSADLVTYTGEILDGKLFLCSAFVNVDPNNTRNFILEFTGILYWSAGSSKKYSRRKIEQNRSLTEHFRILEIKPAKISEFSPTINNG